jgi:hypothetical protein
VRAYLLAEFPEHTLSEAAKATGYYFSVQGKLTGRGTTPHHVRVTEEFVDDHSEEDVTRLLHQFGLANRLRSIAGSKRVVVTRSGLTDEPN